MISIIAAIGKNRELGKDNKLLWHITKDMKRFKRLTKNHVVIMGRKTFDSLPKKFRPLPERINVVVTRNKDFKHKDVLVFNSLEEALKKYKNEKEIFIIGGASIYQQVIKHADKLYLTIINKEFPEANVFFPEYSSMFKKIIYERRDKENDLEFDFIELLK